MKEIGTLYQKIELVVGILLEKNNKEINKMQEEAVAQIEENQEQEKLQE